MQTTEITSLTINAIVSLKQASADVQDDTEFECLESLLDRIYRRSEQTMASAYPQELKD